MSTNGVTLWIPGPWQNRSEFNAAVAATDTGVMAAAGKLFDSRARRHAECELLERNGHIMREMFIGSGRAFEQPTLEAINDHKSIASVTISDTSAERLDDQLDVFTRAVRAAGGVAVKVHYSGLSHGWARWEDQLGSEMPAGLFRLLVVQVRDPEQGLLSSFGMKQFSLPDASIPDARGDVDAAWTLFEFNIYVWDQQPKLENGHTFSRADIGATRYRLNHAVDRRYPEGHHYLNPHGIWELTPV